jgi:MarR family transcriptional regulator, lower aerobic nicotinate degradation pathway regulator
MVIVVNRDGSDFDELRDALVQTSFGLTSMLTEVAAGHDLSLTQLRMLGALRDREPTMAELSAGLGLERSTVSGLIDRAVQRGLVLKATDPVDGRAVRVRLSPQALAVAQEIIGQIGERMAPSIERLTVSERNRLAALLFKMAGPG